MSDIIDDLRVQIDASTQSADKKIDQMITRLERLSSTVSGLENVNLSSFSNSISGFSESIMQLSKVKTTDVNRISKNLEKLQSIDLSKTAASISAFNGLDLSGIQNLGTAFQGLATTLAGTDQISAGTQKIFTSLSTLATASESMPLVIQSMPAMTAAIQNFISGMAAAPSVQDGTTAIITSLSGLAAAGNKAEKTVEALPGLTAGISQFITTLSTMPQLEEKTVRAIEALAKIGPVGSKAGSAARSLQKDIRGLNAAMTGNRTSTNVFVTGVKGFTRSLLGAMGFVGGIYGLIRGAKEAITISSDLTEAQNVVEQGFGDMSDKIEKFAETSIQNFGLSELAAKQTAGLYSVMAKSLGVLPEQATDMAVSLTGLTGDLASFYNTKQDVAQTALKSIFTGETESLKKYGVILTQTNLQQFAYSQGIQKSIGSMTEAEKVQLRYAYVMQATKAAQGDFARTAGGSWANQIRILTEQFRQLAGIIGGGLVAAFLPVVKAINTVVAKIIGLAKVISSFFGGIFGLGNKTGEGAGMSEIADELSNSVDSVDSLGAGASGAADGLGEAADNAKKMADNLQAFDKLNVIKGPDSGSSSGGGGGASIPSFSMPEDYSFEVSAEDNASPVLKQIANRFRQLKLLFADGFRIGLGDVSAFDSIRRNLQWIGLSLKDIFTDSDVINAANNFLNVLAMNLGKSAGAMLSVGATIADNLTGGIAIYLEQSKDRIKKFLIDMFDIGSETSTIIADFQVAFAEIFSAFRRDSAKEITASIIQIFSDGFMGITELAGKLGRDVLGLVLNPITENAEGFRTALENTLAPISEILGTIADSFSTVWTDLNTMYDEHVRPMFESFTSGISEIVSSLLAGYNTYIAPVLDNLAKQFSEVWENAIQPILSNAVGLIGDVADLIKTVWTNILQPAINWIAQNIMPAVAPVLEYLGNEFNKTFQFIGELFNAFLLAARGVIQFLTNIFEGDWSGAWNTVKSSFSAIWSAMPDSITKPIETTVTGLVKFISGAFSGDWKKAWEGIKTVFKGIWDGMPDIIKNPIRSIIGFINKMIGGIESGINAVINGINHLSFDIPDWVPEIGGSTFGFDLNKVSLPRIPELAQGGIVKNPLLAWIGEAEDEAVIPLSQNAQWISKVADTLKNRLVNIGATVNLPKLVEPQVSVPNLAAVSSAVNVEVDARMAGLVTEMREQNNLLREQNDWLSRIYNKPALADRDLFHAVQRGQHTFNESTHKTGWKGID